MNKEITIYELLGLIKDGQAPKKIKYKDNIYYYFSNKVDLYKYETMPTEFQGSLSLIMNNMHLNLNDKVKIIQEDNKIEKLDIKQEKKCKGNWKWKCNGYNISTPQKILGDKINELIDELNKLKENNYEIK